MKASSLLTLAAALVCLQTNWVRAQTPVDVEVLTFVRANEVAMGASDAPLGPAEAALIANLVRGARVIALGEPYHLNHEPLAYRNRMIRRLVMHEGLTAVALETGLAETRKVDDYIEGGPGDARTAVIDNLSWGFNELPENVELIAWLRDWNDTHPSQRVRIYGVDISGGDSKQSFGHARDDLDAVAAYLAKAAATQSAAIRVRLAAIADRFSPEAYARASEVDRAGFADAVADAQAFLGAHAAGLKIQSGEAEWAWAVRLADDAGDALHVFALWPADASKPTPAAIAVAEFRDRAMAERLLWALGREGPRGKALLFQSNSHVAAAALHPVGRPGADGTPTGQYLRKALGEGYRVILTASSMGRTPDDVTIGEVDRVFAAVGPPKAMLDIRKGGPWWGQPHTLSHGGVRVNIAVPQDAYDGLMYIDNLTPVKRISP